MEIAIPGPDLVGYLEKRLLAEFALSAEEWSRCVSALTKWEDDHLLDHPTAELLEAHGSTLQRPLAFGHLLSLATAQPAFPDRTTSDMVAATQVVLEDKVKMWHRKRMTPDEAERILAACFPQ